MKRRVRLHLRSPLRCECCRGLRVVRSGLLRIGRPKGLVVHPRVFELVLLLKILQGAYQHIFFRLLPVPLLPTLLRTVILETFPSKPTPAPLLRGVAQINLRLMFLSKQTQFVAHLLIALPERVNHVLGSISLVWLHESVGKTSLSCTSSAADAMDVVLKVVGNLEIDYQDDLLDVDPACRNRRRNEDLRHSVFEILQSEVPVVLVLPTMQSERGVSILQQLCEELIHIPLLVHKDYHGSMFVPFT
mmetsp:Transcript_55087/g.147028  ORF Transcript_55087/g.147028 Transcript_55087/m.147028 type:complete len:246 (-) Transcript_55087:2168-2905(-)